MFYRLKELKQAWRREEKEDKKEEQSYRSRIFLQIFYFKYFRWSLKVLFQEISTLI